MVARNVCSVLLLASLLQCASAFIAPSPSPSQPLRRDSAAQKAFRCTHQPAGVLGLRASLAKSPTSSVATDSSTSRKPARTAPNAVSFALGFVAAASMLFLPGLSGGHPAGSSFGGTAYAEEAVAQVPDAEHKLLGQVLRLVRSHRFGWRGPWQWLQNDWLRLDFARGLRLVELDNCRGIFRTTLRTEPRHQLSLYALHCRAVRARCIALCTCNTLGFRFLGASCKLDPCNEFSGALEFEQFERG